MRHLQLTPEGRPHEDDRMVPIDDPHDPVTEADLRELELDRATDEGMLEPPGPQMEVPGTSVDIPADSRTKTLLDGSHPEWPFAAAVQAHLRESYPLAVISPRHELAALDGRQVWRAFRDYSTPLDVDGDPS